MLLKTRMITGESLQKFELELGNQERFRESAGIRDETSLYRSN